MRQVIVGLERVIAGLPEGGAEWEVLAEAVNVLIGLAEGKADRSDQSDRADGSEPVRPVAMGGGDMSQVEKFNARYGVKGRVNLGKKEFKNISDSSLLVISLIISVMPGIFWGLCFFRSSKPACTFSLVLLSFALYWFLNNFSNTTLDMQKKKMIGGIFILEVFMLLMDRQGFLLTVVISIGLCLALAVIAFRRQITGFEWLIKLLAATLAALIWGTFYNLYLGPEIIYMVNGYYPDSGYQSMGISSLFNFRDGLSFFMQNMGGILGGLGAWAGYLFTVFIGLGILAPLLRRKSDPAAADKALYCFMAYGYVLVCLIGMANIMLARHPAILWPDVVRYGYFNSFLVIIMFFGVLSLNSILAIWNGKSGRNLVFVLLSVLFLANVLYLPKSRDLILGGHRTLRCLVAQGLLQALRDPSIDYYALDLPVDDFDIISSVRGKPRLKYLP